MTLPDVHELYSTDERCRTLLERLRWPEGVMCPRCKDSRISRLKEYARYECSQCQYQFTVTSGTIFHDSHLQLRYWFLAVLLLVEARKGMSANQLRRTLWGQHKGSYKTAWYLFHRIRAAMKAADRPMLSGTVEMDETYIGGRRRNIAGAQGRSQIKKQVVVGIRQRGGDLRFFHATDIKAGTLAQYIRDNISQDVDVMVTDELGVYPFAMKKAGADAEKHKTIKHTSGQYVIGDVHTNTVESAFSLLKRGIVGSWHRISAKHLPAYLDEMTWRFNNRKNPFLFRDTLLRLLNAPVMEYKKLTAVA